MSLKFKNKKTFSTLILSLALCGILFSQTAHSVPLPKRKPEFSGDIFSFMSFDKVGKGHRLSEKDAALYERIFELQEVGNFKKANKKIAQLSDHLLMGHVLYQRYMGRYYTSTYNELADWMSKYYDHAGAKKLYHLAAKKKPKSGGKKLVKYKNRRPSFGYHNDDIGRLSSFYLDRKRFSGKQATIVKTVKRVVGRSPTYSIQLLEKKENRTLFSNVAYDALRGRIAESYFFNGKAEKAYALATVSAKRSGEEVPIAAWIAGLCSWRYKKYIQAAEYFEIVAKSKRSSAWMASAGAYWAARSYLRGRKPQKVGYWLRKAAESPRSFYGIIAVKALGMENSKFNWVVPQLNEAKAKALAEVPAGKRAMALMDAKKYDYAEGELRQVSPKKSKTIQGAMMAVSHKIGAPDFEMRLGSGLKDSGGKLYDAALYPDALWLPEGEYYIDKALIHAFIRQESKFNAEVRNRSSGAIGLMQLMPRTARNVARKLRLRDSRRDYHNPKINILIGQKYIEELLGLKSVNENLFKLASSYNAGPSKTSSWIKKIDFDGDPLLFIESIPVSETRTFVERVLTNYWIYRLKYGKRINSLEQVASGDWPIYEGN